MASPAFDRRFEQYLAEARANHDRHAHHDQRREAFLSFVHDAFGIDLADIEREQYIQLRGQQVAVPGSMRVRKGKGWIDAIFKDLIFEFKRDYEREAPEGRRELRDYLTNTPYGDTFVGILTDGLRFTAYVLDAEAPDGLRQIDELNLESVSPAFAFQWLDAYLLSQHAIAPTSDDIVRRFGLSSPTFVAAARVLRDALRTYSASEAGAAEVKRRQWAFYLARVYGSADASNDEMFVRHTYLCQFAKILAHAAYFSTSETGQRIEDVISGAAFETLGVSNIGEQDFFAWVLAPEVKAQTLEAFRHIAASLAVYDLSRIDEDLLKQLYQNLVEQETRHELGEFYTPDWLAELTLREIGYGPGKSLLDPACGSGTFLFTAIRLLAEQGVTGAALVDFTLRNVVGLDVHPLAVTIARINYMIAILPHLRLAGTREQRSIPVAMANSLQVPNKAGPVAVISVRFDDQRDFRIPVSAAQNSSELMRVLGDLERRAQHIASEYPNLRTGKFGEDALKRLPASGSWSDDGFVQSVWDTNLRFLAEQIAKGRDTIWAYVLRNTSQPLVLQQRKFDAIAGNPPWIAYRYLQDESYRRDVKTLAGDYGLISTDEVKLNTQIELSTVFYEHCWREFLLPQGIIAFVMPRSTLTGAKQHRRFQQLGFSRILDLDDVAPLFRVPSCVLIRHLGALSVEEIPTTIYAGRLPSQECDLAHARVALSHMAGTTSFTATDEIASLYYHPRVINGATLYPRTLTFVTAAQPGLKPSELATSTIVRTDPDAATEAKEPWKQLALEGHVDGDFLYATLVSKNLVPFGVRRFNLAALPIRIGLPSQVADLPGEERVERFLPMSIDEMRDSIQYARSADGWFAPAEKLWSKYRKSVGMSLWDRFNYQQGVTQQPAVPCQLVVYNASGSNIAATLLDTTALPNINHTRPHGFVLDHTAYWYRCATPDEGHYLAALLNAPSVDAAIKAHQTRGMFGARHIHRRPFEVCPIPQFDARNPDHLQLAALSRQAHDAVAALDLAEGGVVAARKRARAAVAAQLAEMDAITRRLLRLTPVPVTVPTMAAGDDDDEHDLAEEETPDDE